MEKFNVIDHLFAYRDYAVKAKQDKYVCSDLGLKTSSIKDMVNEIDEHLGTVFNKRKLRGGRRAFTILLNHLDFEIVSSGIQKIKKEQGIRNRQEVLKFLIDFYEKNSM